MQYWCEYVCISCLGHVVASATATYLPTTPATVPATSVVKHRFPQACNPKPFTIKIRLRTAVPFEMAAVSPDTAARAARLSSVLRDLHKKGKLSARDVGDVEDANVE